ncbi:MAG: hypothetical protein HKN25_01235 [Pyrinomonadaceae bacterium]|nr:hypothetical protein [Pyrinomonadaceae bacterium]
MKQTISFILLTTVYLSMIAPFGMRTHAQVLGKTRDARYKQVPGGLKFSLSEGVEGAENRVTPEPANTDPLSEGETSNLLKRLPKIITEDGDKTDFAKRAGSLPAPKTGKRIPVKFPASETRSAPNVNNDQALEVTRFSPEGKVALAPDLSVTFSLPMVAVTSQDGAAKTVPVQLTPNAEGKWRWLGTKTLMFDTTKRFRMATKYTARIPAGTKAATGQILNKDVVWTFTTPPPKMLSHFPSKNQTTRRNALMFASFDQEINPRAVLETISVTARGKRLPIRLLTEEEVAKSNLAYYKKRSQPNRWIAFRAVNSEGGTENALPADSPIKVTINKGTPSAEGPLTTTSAQSFSYRTYGAMKFVEGYCNYRRSKNCSPFHTWYLRFSNNIDSSKFDKSMIKISPAVEGLKIYPNGQFVYIQGVKRGRTTYTVSVDDRIRDIYEQNLVKSAKVTIRTGSAPVSLYAQGGNMVVLDPTTKKPSFSVYSTNQPSMRVKVYRVQPQHWSRFQKFVRYRNYDDGTKAPMPGRLISNRIVPIEKKYDEMVETRIDLSRYMRGGFGNVVLDITPTKKRDKYDRTRISTWVQATKIGLDAFVDHEELVGFATDLGSGKPVSGVDLSIYPNGNAVSSNQPVVEEKSYASRAWDWLTSWGSSQANEIQTIDQNGAATQTETIEKATSNRTPANGMLRLPLPTNRAKQPNMLIAKKGRDVAFLPENSDYYYRETGNWYQKPQRDYLRWFVFDDRKMYRPKEEVSVKGYIRKITRGELGDVTRLGDSARGLTYSVKDPRNNEIAKGTLNLNAFGAFDLKFKLPDNANLGNSRVELRVDSGLSGRVFNHRFQIQEFRRPEFEVKSKVASEGPHFVGGKANAEVNATYYAGGGLANAQVNWTVRATATSYTPPNRGDYIFGSWVPWWYRSSRSNYYGGSVKNFKGVTDASGKHNLRIDFESVKPPRPYRVTASSSVQDVNRQTWSSSTSLLVHPADLYVGIKSKRTFVQKGENIEIDSIVSDLDGKLVSGKNVEIKAVLKSWAFEKGGWKEKTIDEQFCNVQSAGEEQKCKFTAKNGGRYIITALVMDDKERFNESEMTVWVAGGKTPPQRNVSKEKVELIPSQKDYKPGDVAEILVISPFAPAEGVLTLRREGIVKTERFTMKESSTTLKIPLKGEYLPNIYAQVDLVGATARTNDKGEVADKLAKRPAFAGGTLNLPISKKSRELTVTADPVDKTVEPAGKTNVNVAVKDYRGEPVANTEVAVVVVDESVLALSGYNLANPLSTFYSNRGAGVSNYHLRKDVLLGNPADVKSPPPAPPATVANQQLAGGAKRKPMARMRANAPAAAKSEAGMLMDSVVREESEKRDSDDNSPGNQDPISLRKNFDALAVFAPNVKTNSSGRAVVPVKLPDNLTRYRVMAVSVDQAKRFGKGESSITAKQPLMVRPSAPRFMNFGDKIELPVVVQNQTDKDMMVNVGVRATNATLTNGGGRKVLIKANDRAEVRFPVTADMAGKARFQMAVNSGRYSDAAEIDLPVWTPATTEAFATYGTTDQNGAIAQPVQAPKDVYSQFGGLEVTTSSTQLQELTDAFIYLYKYRFACSEQISSRMISIAALKDVLTAFKAEEMPKDAAIRSQFARDIKVLQSRQNGNGYFGLWRRSGERYKYPFVTAHVAHALVLAKKKGFKVPDRMITRVKPYLKNIEKHYPSYYGPNVRKTISAYALYVRNLMGDNDEAKAKKLLADSTIQKMPFEALGWTMSVLADGKNSQAEVEAIKRFLLNRTSETAATAQFNTNYGDSAWVIMYSNRRADAVLLEAMLKVDKDNDLVPKLTRGLLAHRKKGRWSNTQENVFILLALDKYFNAYEKVTPNFVNQVWLGKAYAGEQKFVGRSVDSKQLEIPMDYLMKQGGAADLILNKQGAGRLYYRIGMKYAPKNLDLKPADYGFTVLRSYEGVDDADDVKKGADGKWTIKAGARVRVKLTMVAQARRYHVALVDPLPAGLEILNPGLAVTEAIPQAARGTRNTSVLTYGSRSFGRGSYYWRSRWFEHQNFRDERAEAFSSLLWSGVYNYTYVARATTPGEFVVPPAKAEEMYHPETFGRTGTDFVKVE